jgi:hypothetical protein
MPFIRKKRSENRLFVYFSEYGVLVARWSSRGVPASLDFARGFPGGGARIVRPFLEEVGLARQGNLALATCGFSSSDRFLIETELESPSRFRDPQYLSDYLNKNYPLGTSAKQAYVIAPDRGTAMSLGAAVGGRRFLLCGCATESVMAAQQRCLDYGVYPERLELASISCLAAMIVHLKQSYITTPVLVLDVTAGHTFAIILDQCAVAATRLVHEGINAWVVKVQELLKLDESATARRLLCSDNFNFDDMGPELLESYVSELRSIVDYYEVSSGRAIGHIWVTGIPCHLLWVTRVLVSSFKLKEVVPSLVDWLESQGIVADPSVITGFDGCLFRLFSLMGDYDEEEARV